MTRYLCIDENNILKSISDKLYVYKFDPNESGINIDRNTKLVTIGTRTIQYYSDLPMTMTEKFDHTPITISGTVELKPRIEINGVYYYNRYNNRDLILSHEYLYDDINSNNKYIYNESIYNKLELIEGKLLFTQFNSFINGKVTPSKDYIYYDRITSRYYKYDELILAFIPLDEPPVGIDVDKGECIDPVFYVDDTRIESSDRYLYKEYDRDIFYIYKNEFKIVNLLPIEQVSELNEESVIYDSIMNYYLYIPPRYIQATIMNGEYDDGKIINTWSSGIIPDPSYVYYDSIKDSYYRLLTEGFLASTSISCYMSDNKIYTDPNFTNEINPRSDTIYHDLLTTSYYRWTYIPSKDIPCHEGYKEDNDFYDSLHSIYSPINGNIYIDTTTDRFYIYSGNRYSQIHITSGYLYKGKMYSDPNLIDEIELVGGDTYYDISSKTCFKYNSYQWINLIRVEGYLSNGNFYDLNDNYVPKAKNYLYIYNNTYYLYSINRYIKLDPIRCYYEDSKLMKLSTNTTFLFSCIISDQCIEPEYHMVDIGEYCIVPPEIKIDDYIDFINNKSSSIFLDKSGDNEEYLYVANIFGINLNDTSSTHYFNNTNPYGRDNKVLLDEKMQIAEFIRTLKDKYKSIYFYTDPNDRDHVSTHSNEFVYYQSKLFSDDSQYTTPLRYSDYRYGRVRNYDISILIRYESPDMVTFLNRRNDFLIHKFLNPVQDVMINLDNGDLIHIGVNWSRSIREEEPDKNLDASERNVYTFITQCNLNGLILERSDTPTSIEEIITSIYSISEPRGGIDGRNKN